MAIRINDVPPKYRAILEKVDTQPKDGYIVDKEIVPAANAVLSELGVSSSIKPEEAEQFLLRVLDIKPVTLPAPSTGVGGPTISRKINGVTYSLEKTVADDKITYRWCSDETKPFIEITVEDILKDKNLKVLYAL